MMNLFIDPQGNYPRHRGDLQLDHPSWRDGDDLPQGWVEVREVEAPVKKGYFKVLELPPVEAEGKMQQAWAVREMTPEEKIAYDEAMARRPE